MLLFLVLAGALIALWPPVAWAQGSLPDEEVCRDDPSVDTDGPYSEHCICAKVRKFHLYPRRFQPSTDPPGTPVPVNFNPDGSKPFFNEDTDLWEGDPDGPLPSFNEDTGLWEGDPEDLGLFVSDKYGQECSLSYVRENLRRAWYFLAAVGAGFAAISLSWAGVVYMQESSSGGDLSRARGMLVRVMIGVVILACALIAWEGLSGFVVDYTENWTLDRDVFYRSYD